MTGVIYMQGERGAYFRAAAKRVASAIFTQRIRILPIGRSNKSRIGIRSVDAVCARGIFDRSFRQFPDSRRSVDQFSAFRAHVNM